MNLLITLDYKSQVPLYKQLHESICNAIECGRLKPGDRVPPTRELAKQLNLSRVTVLRCYKTLLNEGHFEAGHGLGTRVSRQLANDTIVENQKRLSFEPGDAPDFLAKPSQFAHQLSSAQSIDIKSQCAYSSELPIKQWQQCVVKSAKTLNSKPMLDGDEKFGYRPLRQAIAKVLNRTRAASCNADQILVYSSRAKALDAVSRLLIDRDELIAVEDPGDPDARRIFEANGARLSPIPIDEQGLLVSHLESLSEPLKMVHTTPSHQNPCGTIMSTPRRIELLNWARKNGAIILEDDFDGFFRFGGQASTASLRSIDDQDLVIYLCDLSSLMRPLTQLAFLVVPNQLIDLFWKAQTVLGGDDKLIESLTLTEFINSGSFDSHLRKVINALQKCRQTLMYSLAINFRNLIEISRNSTGRNILVRFHDEYLSNNAYLQCSYEAGLKMVSTESNYLSKQCKREFLIDYSQAEPYELVKQVSKMSSLVAKFVPDIGEETTDFSASPSEFPEMKHESGTIVSAEANTPVTT